MNNHVLSLFSNLNDKEVLNAINTQGNSLQEISKCLGFFEYKLFLLILSKIPPVFSTLPVLKISTEEFAESIGTDLPDVYSDLQRASDQLMTRVITTYYPEENMTQKSNLTSRIVHYWSDKCVEIHLSKYAKSFFINLRREFAQQKFVDDIKLSNIYTIRLYDLLRSTKIISERVFNIRELQKKLGISQRQRTDISNFENYILKTAQRELNAKTDIHIDIDFKTQRKLTYIKFKVTKKYSWFSKFVAKLQWMFTKV